MSWSSRKGWLSPCSGEKQSLKGEARRVKGGQHLKRLFLHGFLDADVCLPSGLQAASQGSGVAGPSLDRLGGSRGDAVARQYQHRPPPHRQCTWTHLRRSQVSQSRRRERCDAHRVLGALPVVQRAAACPKCLAWTCDSVDLSSPVEVCEVCCSSSTCSVCSDIRVCPHGFASRASDDTACVSI